MEGIILPVIISSIRSLKDGSVSILTETQELSPGKAGELFSLRNKTAMAYFSPKETISQKELNQIDSLDADIQGKTPSQRLRSVLYVNWQQKPEGFKTFLMYYQSKMEVIINHYKNKLEP